MDDFIKMTTFEFGSYRLQFFIFGLVVTEPGFDSSAGLVEEDQNFRVRYFRISTSLC